MDTHLHNDKITYYNGMDIKSDGLSVLLSLMYRTFLINLPYAGHDGLHHPMQVHDERHTYLQANRPIKVGKFYQF